MLQVNKKYRFKYRDGLISDTIFRYLGTSVGLQGITLQFEANDGAIASFGQSRFDPKDVLSIEELVVEQEEEGDRP